MVGGRVIELRDDVVCGQNVRRVWCMDRNGDECAIYVARPDADRVAIGDQVWWQGRNRRYVGIDRQEVLRRFDERVCG